MTSTPSAVDPGAGERNRVGAEPPRTRVWRDGELEAEGFPVAQVSDYLEEPGTLVWLDLCAPDHKGLSVISDELNLHGTSVEDAVSAHERSKLDRYEGYLFFNGYWLEPDGDGLAAREISAFITERALVTVRQDGHFPVDRLIARWDDSSDLVANGVSALLHGLLDMIVDQDFEIIQSLDDEADELEELLFDESSSMRDLQRRSYRLRKNLVQVRRKALPMREVVNTLLRRDLHVVAGPMVPYFQDVYDHTLRAAEWTDSLREVIANLLDTRLAMQDNRLNEVMKKITSWAAIIAVPTAVTGFYGQNVPYPGFQATSGFVVSSIIMILLSVGLYAIFKQRDWL